MNPYQTHALEGASGVELTVALYDGIIRFTHEAIDAVERGNPAQRRVAVRRAMDIVIHLQATLRMDIGGKPAEALAEFYVAIFSMLLQGSQSNSKEKFERVIRHVRNVRNAWKQVANDTGSHGVSQGVNSPLNSLNVLEVPYRETGPANDRCWTV